MAPAEIRRDAKFVDRQRLQTLSNQTESSMTQVKDFSQELGSFYDGGLLTPASVIIISVMIMIVSLVYKYVDTT